MAAEKKFEAEAKRFLYLGKLVQKLQDNIREGPDGPSGRREKVTRILQGIAPSGIWDACKPIMRDPNTHESSTNAQIERCLLRELSKVKYQELLEDRKVGKRAKYNSYATVYSDFVDSLNMNIAHQKLLKRAYKLQFLLWKYGFEGGDHVVILFQQLKMLTFLVIRLASTDDATRILDESLKPVMRKWYVIQSC